MPMRKSRGEPKRRRSGPVQPAASRPPMVWPGELNGSTGRNWPLLPSSAWSASSVIPASTLTTMSACECSSTRSRAVVRSSMLSRAGGSPISAARPPPTGKTASPASAASWSRFARSAAVTGFSTAALLIRGPRELTASASDIGVPAKSRRSLGLRGAKFVGFLPPLGLDRETRASGELGVLAFRVGEDLARVHDPVRVQRDLHTLHRIEVVGAVDPGHEGALLESDPMLARECTTQLDDRAQHLFTCALHLRQHVAFAKVEQDVGMQVAVARVEDIRNRKLVVDADLADSRQDLGQLGARHDTVVQVVVGLDATERADRALAACPQEVALGRTLGFAHRVALVLREHPTHRGHQLEGRLGNAVDLGQEDRAGVGRIARLVVRLHRADGNPVHHLERRWDYAGSDDRGHRLAGRLDGGERGEQRGDAGRGAQEAHLDLRDGAKRSFRADEYAAKVEPNAIRRISTYPLDASVGEHHLHAEDVIRGDAVVKAVRAA